jgi:hypothetical protein
LTIIFMKVVQFNKLGLLFFLPITTVFKSTLETELRNWISKENSSISTTLVYSFKIKFVFILSNASKFAVFSSCNLLTVIKKIKMFKELLNFLSSTNFEILLQFNISKPILREDKTIWNFSVSFPSVLLTQ